MLVYTHIFVIIIAMAGTRYFLNLIKSRINLPLPEPERSEALEYFNFVDFDESEFYELWNDEFITKDKKARLNALIILRNKYVCSGRYEYYFESDDDGSSDALIQRYISSLNDKDSYCLDERQRQIAMDLIELQLLNENYFELNERKKEYIYSVKYHDPKYEIPASVFEKVLKWRYLNMKYGRQKRLEAEERERKARQRSIDAACLCPGFTIDW